MSSTDTELPVSNDMDENAEERPLNYSFWLGALIIRGSILPRVIGDILCFGLFALAVVFLSNFTQSQYGVTLSIPQGPFSAAGAVLGLLLVMRTNAGYDRWWEARKLWGGIVNQSRNLGVMALAYGPHDPEWRRQFITWVAAFPHVIRCSLRYETALPEVEQLLGEANTKSIAKAGHMPSYVARQLADLLQAAKKAELDSFSFFQIEEQRQELINYVGGCERIRNTPLARSSAIQVRQFILLFLVTLPFALLGDFQDHNLLGRLVGLQIPDSVLFVPLFIMLVAWPLLSLDRIGMELQNPFDTRRSDHLPLDTLCHTIEKNLIELLRKDTIFSQSEKTLESTTFTPEMVDKLNEQNKTGETWMS
jgi:putative membrane protein